MQEEIIQAAISGNDALALLPTGGGKSICFQIPALAQEGICLVISPLIALMKDQVENLKKRGISAEAIYSGLSKKDIDRILDNCIYGNIKFLYLSPERLKSDLARSRIAQMKVNLIAVDEAHCISQWGYDFRPPYLDIAEIRPLHPEVPILALTATATKEVVDDIQEKLQFEKNNLFQKSFARKNLAYVVLHEEHKEKKLLEILNNVKGSSVVYVRNRRKTKEIALQLRKKGISADFYHAGLKDDERTLKQKNWIENKLRVMVSTNAFGMGIDKPDVRSVVHMDLPDSLEAYFQEAGRAGRDGQKAYAVLLYAEKDEAQLNYNFENSFPDFKEIKRVYNALGSYFQLAIGAGANQSFDFEIQSFCKNFNLEIITTFSALKILEKEGWLILNESFFKPSTIKFRVSRETLYDFQLKNAQFNSFIKTLLRAHEGLFNHHITVDEYRLARFMKISDKAMFNALKILHKEQILEYRPRNDKPQIIFIRERVASNNLSIDNKAYQFRKKAQKKRIDMAITYANVNLCRSRFLLQYFGEFSKKNCGICDICLERNKSSLGHEEYERLKDKIFMVLDKGPLEIEFVVDSFHPKKREKVFLAIEYLIEENILIQKSDQIEIHSNFKRV